MDAKQWLWMMDYCKDKHIPPAEDWVWKEARSAYNKWVRSEE